MPESKIVKLNFETVIFSYVFSMLSLGCILISDLVDAEFFIILTTRYDPTLATWPSLFAPKIFHDWE